MNNTIPSLEDSQDWLEKLISNNPEGELLANFIRRYSERHEWMDVIERNNPDHKSPKP